MAAWIKMKLGMDQDATRHGAIGLGAGDFVLEGDPLPSPKGAEPTQKFSAYFLLWTNGWIHQNKKKRTEVYLYSAFIVKHSKRSGVDHTVLPANNTTPAFPS